MHLQDRLYGRLQSVAARPGLDFQNKNTLGREMYNEKLLCDREKKRIPLPELLAGEGMDLKWE